MHRPERAIADTMVLCCVETVRCSAHSSALQVLYLEAFVTAPSSGGGEESGVWAVLRKWATEGGGAGRLHSLLQRYCRITLSGSGEVSERLCLSAEAAAIELLSSILSGTGYSLQIALKQYN